MLVSHGEVAQSLHTPPEAATATLHNQRSSWGKWQHAPMQTYRRSRINELIDEQL